MFYYYVLFGCSNWGFNSRLAWPKGNKSDDEITKRRILLRDNKRANALGWAMLEVWALACSLKCQRSWGDGWWGWGSITQHCWSWCRQTPSPQYYCVCQKGSRACNVTLVAQKARSPQWKEKGTSVEVGHVQVSCPHVSIKCHSSKLGYGLGANGAKPCLWWIIHCRRLRCKVHSCICAIAACGRGPVLLGWWYWIRFVMHQLVRMNYPSVCLLDKTEIVKLLLGVWIKIADNFCWLRRFWQTSFYSLSSANADSLPKLQKLMKCFKHQALQRSKAVPWMSEHLI